MIPSDPCSSQKMPILDNRVCVSKRQCEIATCYLHLHNPSSFLSGNAIYPSPEHMPTIVCGRLARGFAKEFREGIVVGENLQLHIRTVVLLHCPKTVYLSLVSCSVVCVLCVLWQVRTYNKSFGSRAAFRKLPTPAGRMVPRQTCSPSFQEPLERFVHTRHVTTGVRRSSSNLLGNHEDLRHPTSELYDFYIKKSTWIQKPPQETQEKHLTSCCSCQFGMLLIIFLSQARPAQGARGAVVRSEDSRKHPESNESRRASSPKCCNIPPCQGLPVKIQSEDFWCQFMCPWSTSCNGKNCEKYVKHRMKKWIHIYIYIYIYAHNRYE